MQDIIKYEQDITMLVQYISILGQDITMLLQYISILRHPMDFFSYHQTAMAFHTNVSTFT